MSQLRLNPLTGRWVAVAVDRSTRPADLVSHPEPTVADATQPCPFCPGHEEATRPALETYDREGSWAVRVVPNRYPAFEGEDSLYVRHLGPVFTQAAASGIHEVLVFTPKHDATWIDLDDTQIALTMAALRDRMEEHASHPAVRYTQAIVNYGHDAGASLEHPHGQLLGMPFVPGEIVEEEASFRRFGGSCLLCTTIEAELDAKHRVVLADDDVVVLSPYWSGVPYEMLVVPRDHQTRLTSADPDDLTAIGKALRTVLTKLRGCIGPTSYNVVAHTAPHRSDAPFHWHLHIWPRVTSIAGFEQGTGVMINILAPELATQHLGVVG